MDEEHLMAAARYVAMNPVRARLVERAEDCHRLRRLVKARAQLQGREDMLK
jgi:putative transposase